MQRQLPAIARRLWPELETLAGRARVAGLGNVFGTLYPLPLAIAGLVWLTAATDADVVRSQWPALLVVLGILYVFERLDFFYAVEIEKGLDATATGTPAMVLAWAAALIYGPVAIWLMLAVEWVEILRGRRRDDPKQQRWFRRRQLSLGTAEITIPTLIALAVYEALGGVFPLPALTTEAGLPALYATLVRVGMFVLVELPFVLYYLLSPSQGLPSLGLTGRSRLAFLRFVIVVLGWPLVIDPFAILLAGLLGENKPVAAFFVLTGLLVASVLAHHLGRAVDRGRQRSRELEQLERLGRDIIEAPPDGSKLEELLEEHASNMFAYSTLEIRLFPDRTLLLRPDSASPTDEAVWNWLASAKEARFFPRGGALPWGGRQAGHTLIAAPVLDVETQEAVGGVTVRRRLVGSDPGSQLPAVQSLAAQIASALHRTREYERRLAHERVEQELAVAAEIQASFMPRAAPEIPGWEIRGSIESAREASGDFIDVIPFDDGRFGLLVADVSGKGVPAALYMALSRTIIRTYAFEHQDDPAGAVAAANKRILSDTDDDLFVTAFYGVLDPSAGTLHYANAGHNPPYLLRAGGAAPIEELEGTGVPLGLLPDAAWSQRTVRLSPGDTLVVYTDGVPDAQNAEEEPFGEERMVETIRTNLGRSAEEIRDALSGAVREFVGDAPQLDDVTVMIVSRNGTP